MTAARRRQGEGSITQIKRTGRWRGRVELPPDPITGARRQKDVTAKTRGEVVKAMNGLRAAADKGTIISSSPTLNEWLDHWLDVIVDVRPKTWDTYRSSLEYARRSMGRKRLENIDVADIRALHSRMASGALSPSEKPLSATTIHAAHQTLSSALSDAMIEQRVSRNVCKMVRPPSRATPPVKVLAAAEVAEVVLAVAIDRLGSRWAAALLTAMRQGELLGLEWSRVDFEANTLDVSWQLQRIPQKHGCAPRPDGSPSCLRKRGAECTHPTIKAKANWEHRHLVGGLYLARPKTKTGYRLIPLVEPLRSILYQRYLESSREPNPHDLVWTSEAKRDPATGKVLPLDGSPIDPSADSKAWHDALERAGVSQVRLHDARHTAITMLYDQGVPEATIQQIAGQSTVATTRAYKAKFSYQLVEAMDQLSSAMRATPALTQK